MRVNYRGGYVVCLSRSSRVIFLEYVSVVDSRVFYFNCFGNKGKVLFSIKLSLI